jgi:diadenosine tetraphosphatase ApaH/serine/threonine PP2A family protein phosphatase
MRIALLSDIHSNLEALQACMAHARRRGADQIAFLGDLVGYGADPCACLDLVMELAARGAPVVRGNHDDAALGGLCADMNIPSRDAIYWTRRQLQPKQREFLAALPMSATLEGMLLVHASADRPAAWIYVSGAQQAGRSLEATNARLVCCGHVHTQHLYYTAAGVVRSHPPTADVAIPLSRQRRWLAIVGSVGQPRDGNPAAAYALLDSAIPELHFFRVPYDNTAAARKIVDAGLPERLGLRLLHGH